MLSTKYMVSWYTPNSGDYGYSPGYIISYSDAELMCRDYVEAHHLESAFVTRYTVDDDTGDVATACAIFFAWWGPGVVYAADWHLTDAVNDLATALNAVASLQAELAVNAAALIAMTAERDALIIERDALLNDNGATYPQGVVLRRTRLLVDAALRQEVL